MTVWPHQRSCHIGHLSSRKKPLFVMVSMCQVPHYLLARWKYCSWHFSKWLLPPSMMSQPCSACPQPHKLNLPQHPAPLPLLVYCSALYHSEMVARRERKKAPHIICHPMPFDAVKTALNSESVSESHVGWH